MVKHIADTFYPDAGLLEGRVINDGTAVIAAGLGTMFLEDDVEAQGDPCEE